VTVGNWTFDVVANLTAAKPPVAASVIVDARDANRVSRFVPIVAEAFTCELGDGDGEATFECSSLAIFSYVAILQSAHTPAGGSAYSCVPDVFELDRVEDFIGTDGTG
jgi:hypothetical protein